MSASRRLWVAVLAALAGLVGPALLAQGPSITLVRQPYLQRTSASEVTVVWASLEPGPAEVRYQLNGAGPVLTAAAQTTRFAALQTGMAADYYQHEARITGLASQATYTYDVFVQGTDATAVTDHFTTAPPPGTGPISFVAFGDSGGGTAGQAQIADVMAAGFAAGRWDFAVHTGDVVYPSSTYQLLHDRFFAYYEDWLRRWPIFLAIGNHEDYADEGRPYLDLFVLPENGDYTQFPDHRERYYSFDYGPVHFVVIDTQNAFNGNARRQAQIDWLVRDLEATAQPWRIAVFHVPGYGSGPTASAVNVRNALQPIFERYGVQLTLTGHQHVYARGIPWREAPALDGLVAHVVTGGGGASLNDVPVGKWTAAAAKAFHAVSVSVTDCQVASSCTLTLEAIGTDGQVFDAFTLPLREQQTDAAAPTVSWVNPPQGAVLSGTTTLEADAADDSVVAKVDVLVDGVPRFLDAAEPFAFAWETEADLNGPHVLQLRAFDIAGRVTVSVTRDVTIANPLPVVRIQTPIELERVHTTLPYMVRWSASPGDRPLVGLRVDGASDGKTFAPLAGCAALPPAARECLWSAPSPVSSKFLVRVVATDELGREASDTSGRFSVTATSPSLLVKHPNKTTTVGIGTRHTLTWSHSAGRSALVRLDLTRDGGAATEPIEPEWFSTGAYPWLVTGPATAQARFSVSSLTTPLTDDGNALFTIAPPALSIGAPSASTAWVAQAQVTVKWVTNLGDVDRVNVRLSTDGGATYPIVLAAAVPASAKKATFRVPAVPTAGARVKVESLQNPAWSAVNPANFTIAP